MSEYADVLNRIAASTGAIFRPAAETDLESLRSLHVPPAIIDFYAKHEPEHWVDGQVRLWTIGRIMEENRDMVPGCYLVAHGYVVFASTIYGDPYCFDTHYLDALGVPRIVLISHEFIGEDVTAEQAARYAKPVAADLHERLERFAAGNLDDECLYE
ncbi:MAG: SMI1/KNR4 family protein [Verrucomicrobia bacterium]|nr:SMI1/KNR4 family protein [Verrucomicrobiota bacterium]